MTIKLGWLQVRFLSVKKVIKEEIWRGKCVFNVLDFLKILLQKDCANTFLYCNFLMMCNFLMIFDMLVQQC